MLSHDDVIRKFEAHREAAAAPTSPDLFAPDNQPAPTCWIGCDAEMAGKFAEWLAQQEAGDAATLSFDDAVAEVIADDWADEAAELADMIADAVRPGDANYTLLLRLTRKLQAHIRRA